MSDAQPTAPEGARKAVLIVAGLDPSGGAGLLADVRTIAGAGLHPVGVAAALTVQDSARCHSFVAVDADLVSQQIEVLVEDLGAARIGAIKIGMVGSAAVARAVARAVAPLVERGVPLVLDPVLRASVGADLLDGEPAEALAPLLALARLVTPNRAEAEALTGLEVDGARGQRRAAHALRELGPRAALVKGGHLEGDPVIDLLDDGGEAVELAAPRLPGPTPHGTGCALSSAIAARLALGQGLRPAVEGARAWLRLAIAAARPIGHGRPGLDLDHGAGQGAAPPATP